MTARRALLLGLALATMVAGELAAGPDFDPQERGPALDPVAAGELAPAHLPAPPPVVAPEPIRIAAPRSVAAWPAPSPARSAPARPSRPLVVAPKTSPPRA